MQKIDVRRFATMQPGQRSTVCVEYEERETEYAGCFKGWKRWGWRRARTTETHAAYMDMTFMRSNEEFE